MEAIREVFSKPIDRRIEEVIKVDQADEKTVLDELQEYVITESIGDHFITVYKAIADAPSDPHEGIGIWVSGFFGSGKSSFAKILGYTVGGQSASQLVQDKARQELPKFQADTLAAYLGVINANIPTQAIIFDVSMDRGVRTANERITEIMYKALLRELGYAEDFDLAELEMSLEADELLDTFREEFQQLHNKRWEERRKLGRGINEASAVLHRLDPHTDTSADSWARSLAQGRADITPNLLAERAFELARRRRPGDAVLFIIDEVGQYVSRSVDKMLDLQAVVQAFGREGKNRVSRKQATAPCWIVVTSQEKLHEVVDALDSKKIELARLQDRFPYPIDLKQSDISEVTSKRVLYKNPHGAHVLGELFVQHEGRLKTLCTLERTSRNTAIDLPRTSRNLAAVLHPRIDADSLLAEVETALKQLEAAQIVRESEEGFKLLTMQEKYWDTTRRALDPKPADRNRIKRELLQEIFADPTVHSYRYQNRKAFPLSLTIDGEALEGTGQLPLEPLLADDSEDFEATCEDARRASNEKRHELFWTCALTEEAHRYIEELYCSREMISMHKRLAAQGKLLPEEASCLAEEKVRRDRIQRTLHTRLAERVAVGAGFFQGIRKDASALGQTLAEVFARLRDEAIPVLYPKFEMGNRPVRPDDAEKFLTAANLNGLPPIFYEEPEGLNLVIRQSGRAVPNLNAEICREVLDYLRREHTYGNKVTGKSLDTYFQGVGYAWERDVLRIVLAVLLRGGAIEVTHQGRKYRNHNDPVGRQPFINNNAFRAASFAPREALDLKMLTDAARHYEAITGNEVDIEEGALAQAFQRLAAEDRDLVLPLVEKMRTAQLPGVQPLEEFQETIMGILDMPTDDCVKTLAGEGKSYQEARARAQRLHDVLTPQNLQLLRSARRALDMQYPILKAHEPSEEAAKAEAELRTALESEWFYEHLEVIRRATELRRSRYQELYRQFHQQRHATYFEAIDEIKGLPEWGQVADWVKSTADSAVREERNHRLEMVLSRLANKIYDLPDLSDASEVCSQCHATIAQMESDIAAVETLKSPAIRELQELAAPEKKIVRVRVSSVLGSIVETPEDVEQAVDRLKEHLLKLLAEDTRTRIVLE